jgi:hypothetical protein
MMNGPAVLEVLDASVKAYNFGRGELWRKEREGEREVEGE